MPNVSAEQPVPTFIGSWSKTNSTKACRNGNLWHVALDRGQVGSVPGEPPDIHGKAQHNAMPKKTQLKLKAGDPAPEFTALTHTGEQVSLSQFLGKQPVVLYFYPKDDTPGCTKEACSFRDQWASVRKTGLAVLGVSTDSVNSHAKFAEKYKLPFTLLADEDKKIVSAYGVWGEKVFMGRKYQGTHRVTFLIGRDGRIQHIWEKVKPEGHAAEVLAVARQAT